MTGFTPLFTLKVTHAFHAGICPDIDVAATAETLRALRGARLVLKHLDGVLHVLYESVDGPLVTAPGRALRFTLRVREPSFANVTELVPGSGVLCYDNHASPRRLGPPVRRAPVGASLSHRWQRAARPATATLHDETGLPCLPVWRAAVGDSRPTVHFDLGGRPPGVYRLREVYPADEAEPTEYYHHPEVLQALAVVDIKIDASFYGEPAAFEVAFAARRETLRYYFVLRNYASDAIDGLTVTDRGAAADQRDPLVFARMSDDALARDPVGARLGGSDVRVVAFCSASPVARRLAARRKIQLQRGNNEVLLQHLPQPDPEQAEAALILHLTR